MVLSFCLNHHYRKMREFEPHSQQAAFWIFFLEFIDS
jgi:hypothetical protein